MTVQEFQAEKIENGAGLLAFWLGKMPEEKRNWTPAVEGAASLRTPLELVAECTAVNRMIAGLLKGDPPPTTSPLETPGAADLATAQDELIASGKLCAEAVRALSDADLERVFTTRRGPMPGYRLIELPYRNMAYHGGQLNYIQLLYGDTEFHIPTPAPNK